jgi:DNA-binding response OmpR family regulator
MKTVLIVEDEASIARILDHNLARAGFVTTIASDGETALECVRATRPDLVILDCLLPQLDGWAVAERLKADQATADIPILMLSIVADRERGLATGAVEYMTKPFAMHDLVARVQRMLA